ncbi:hypothetical protein C5167_033570 [Papaver somniferum]|uniref:Uncharacterized protein n=1 Tax=Papaver somniferum TaxID=3469 RepID=A0A4Y7KAJ6_PAPSO|nr:hypothetical protein C5167_033570 [Papaver somniferum]
MRMGGGAGVMQGVERWIMYPYTGGTWGCMLLRLLVSSTRKCFSPTSAKSSLTTHILLLKIGQWGCGSLTQRSPLITLELLKSCEGTHHLCKLLHRNPLEKWYVLVLGIPQSTCSGQMSRIQMGEAVSSLVGHTQCVSSVVWPEERTIYSASWDHSIRSWDVETGRDVLSLFCRKVLNDLDVGGDSSALIAASGSDPVLRIWDPQISVFLKSSPSLALVLQFASYSSWITACKCHDSSRKYSLIKSMSQLLKLKPISPEAGVIQKGSYLHHKELKAAHGVNINAQALIMLSLAVFCMWCPDDDVENIKEATMQDMTSIMRRIEKSGTCVCVQASIPLSVV